MEQLEPAYAIGRRVGKSVGALSLLILMSPAENAAAASYLVTDLATLAEGTTLVIRGPNGKGTAVGGGKLVGKNRAVGQRKGLLLGGGAVEQVNGLAGSDYTTVLAVNDTGSFVGSANTATSVRAFRGGRGNSMIALPLLSGDSSSSAFAVNNRGSAAGYSSGPGGERAVMWRANNAVTQLPGLSNVPSRALGINDRGDVVGIADTGGGRRAVLWPAGGSAVELTMMAGYTASEAAGINTRGDTVGYSATASGMRHATLWAANGGPSNLGVLPGGDFSQAFGNNDRGEIVGTSTSSAGNRAVLWTRSGQPQDLNALIAPAPIVLTKAVGINNAGMIVAVGRDAEAAHDDGEHPDHGHDHGHDHEAPVRVFLLERTGGKQ